MDIITSPEAGLFGLFLSSFLAATLLPGGSELVLVALLLAHPEQAATALLLATLGNTLGGMTTYGLGRLIPVKIGAGPSQAAVSGLPPPGVGGSEPGLRAWGGNKVGAGGTAPGAAQFAGHHTDALRRWGPAVLLLSWAPLAGDALCAAAGWLRLPLLPCALWMAAGKGARYAFLAWLTL